VTSRQTLQRAWNRFWFRDIPPHIYAVLRVAFGVLGLLNLLGTTPPGMFWDASGLVPLPGGGAGLRAWAVDGGLGTPIGWAFFFTCVAAFTAMTLGVRARLSVVAAFLASLLQTRWNPLPLSLAHQVLVATLFTVMWAETGEVLAVGRRPRQLESCPVWPLRLLQIQVSLIYLNSGLWKLLGSAWRDGTAVYYALANDVFQRFPGGVPPGIFWMSAAATYLTLAWEIAFPVLVIWRPTRRLALGLGVLLHLGTWVTMEIGAFSWMMLATYVAFLDPVRVAAFVTRIDSRLQGRASLEAPPDWHVAGPAGR